MSFQDALYTLEMGKGRRWVQIIAIVCGFVFLSLLYYLLVFRGFYHTGAMDTAQLARQLATGQGYTTKVIRPAALREYIDYNNAQAIARKSAVERIDVFKLSDISNAPVYPAVLSALFKVLGTKFDVDPKAMAESRVYNPERVIVFFNEFCVFLTACLLFFWAWRMFDDRVAFVATIAFVGCDLIWQFAISGLSTTWVMLLLTAVGATLHEALIAEEEDRRGAVWAWATASAVLLVLTILSRLTLAWLLLPYAAVTLISLRRLVLPPLLAIAIVLVGILPWFARNYMVCGDPFGTGLSLVADMSEDNLSMGDRTYAPAGGLPVKAALLKIFGGFGYAMGNFFSLEGTSVLILLFVVGLLHRFKRQRTQHMRWLLVGCTFFLILGGSLLTSAPKPLEEGNNLILIFPGLAAVGAAFFYVLLDRLDLGLQILRYVVVAFFLAVCCSPLVMTLLHPGVGYFRYPPYHPPMIRFVGQLLKPDELLVADIGPAAAWYGDRTTLWMPRSLKEFYEINDSVQLARGLLVTPLSWNIPLYQIEKGTGSDWAPIIKRQGLPSGFPLSSYTPMPPGDNEYLFFSDRRRW